MDYLKESAPEELTDLLTYFYSVYDPHGHDMLRIHTVIVYINVLIDSISETVWPDTSLGIFAPGDENFSLPGNVGLASDFQKKKHTLDFKHFSGKESKNKSDVLTHVLPNERHKLIFFQALDMQEEMALTEELERQLIFKLFPKPKNGETLECIAQECSALMKKDLKDLFPDRNISNESLTVITISQKTVNDMSTWSEDVEEEREQLTESFMDAAENVCGILIKEGFWADFIDPATGKPHLGSYTNAVLSETDERYRHFGFSIEDLGCCKVISHHIWGTKAFVGSLFSNAPIDNATLKEILIKYTNIKDDDMNE
ncbi:Methylmalonic aciduria and homocystinuria type D, mitochondrial [Nymphon striatum]|nr:Methylmalonic aciduria and homocystinuria type D, mitochondrial [Nymphon striatum]